MKLKDLKIEASCILDQTEDSVIIFSSRQRQRLEREILGKEKAAIDNFL
ncbi:CRISPR-associated protein Cas2 family protein [Porphyromonas endodontalis ATCC 35406]|uniref:CRISPR-associated protein Cas2 family protein n=1 Tax=Porphyromonas endodontalis (strain ATCC 35406 / DSM 24491 / JCM 8526 / CCUG 16442 / BCRC 14492 / NCTC 13058 / HG 370) TaxID=553175 RepID=C3JAC6_POREA|nr:CRISPR-associated protein Cas2 family protein [Porphyromonas endodontalis ATCC 35406]